MICLYKACAPVVPQQVGLRGSLQNPALPRRRTPIPSQLQPTNLSTTLTDGIGPKRVYIDVQNPPNFAYPPRPVPGSIADLDVVMEHCDFSSGNVSSH